MFLSSTVWGPHYWFVLQTIAMSYPKYPNDICKKKYYNFIQNLPVFIPNKKIGNAFAKMLNEFPISPYLSSRLSFMKWVHFMHNKINKKLNKPEMNFFQGLEQYYKHYIPEKTKKLQQQKIKKQYIFGITSLLFIIFIWYKYK